jgi:TPR repeat protein
LYEEAALDGHAEAQFYLGLLYFNGQGTKVDFDQATEWFKMASQNGVAKAESYLVPTV